MAEFKFKNLDIVFENVKEDVEDVVKETALDVINTLSDDTHPYGTPVLTGWAISNWRVNSKTPIVENAAPKATEGEIAASFTRQAQSIKNLDNFNITTDKAIYVTDNVPYIAILNDGTETRPPRNFIDGAAREAAFTADRKLREKGLK